jgi:hypothetical protein
MVGNALETVNCATVGPAASARRLLGTGTHYQWTSAVFTEAIGFDLRRLGSVPTGMERIDLRHVRDAQGGENVDVSAIQTA